MSVRAKLGNGQTKLCTEKYHGDPERLAYVVAELQNICNESRLAGSDVWYELEAYVRASDIEYQIQRHGSVIGGGNPALPGLCSRSSKANFESNA